MQKVGLVTVLYRCDEVLEGFFRSLSQQTFQDYHLYLIDNSPSDQTTALIEKLLKKYPVNTYTHILNEINNGVAGGNNQGIKLSMSDNCIYTLLLNNDIEFDNEHLLASIVSSAESTGQAIIVPKILFYDTRKIWMAGGRMIKQAVFTDHIGFNQENSPIYNKPGYISYAPTCFMLVDNKVFRKIGLMDEQYFAYYDDTDFVIRATNAGYTILYQPHLCILHKVSSSTGGTASHFSIYYTNRNRIIFWRKHYTPASKLTSMPFLLYSFLFQFYRCDKENWNIFLKGIKDGLSMQLARQDTQY